MATMRQEIVKVYDSREWAEQAGEDLKKWFGYEYKVEPESDDIYNRRWKLTATTKQVMMG